MKQCDHVHRFQRNCQEKCNMMMCDNSSINKLSKNLVLHGRGKNIDEISLSERFSDWRSY